MATQQNIKQVQVFSTHWFVSSFLSLLLVFLRFLVTSLCEDQYHMIIIESLWLLLNGHAVKQYWCAVQDTDIDPKQNWPDSPEEVCSEGDLDVERFFFFEWYSSSSDSEPFREQTHSTQVRRMCESVSSKCLPANSKPDHNENTPSLISLLFKILNS